MKPADQSAVDRRPSSASQTSIPSESLARTRRLTVRLTVIIPAIMSFLSIGGSVLVREQLLAIAAGATVPRSVREGMEFASDLVMFYTIVVAVISALVGLLLALQIVKPLREIESSMAALARGETPRLPSTPLGEFSFLGSTFNSMVTHLEHLFAERDRQMQESAARSRFLLDKSGKIVSAEGSLRRMLNLSPRDVVGISVHGPIPDSISREAAGDVLRACAEILPTVTPGGSVDRDVVLTRGGETTHLAVVLSSLVSGIGGAEQWLLEVRDVTGIQSFREQMQRADRLAAVGTLATGIAHEIRNPLASMKGMIQLLEEQSKSPNPPVIPPAEFHRRVIGEIERLERLVNAIMDFAQGDPEPPNETDVNEIIRAVAEASMAAAGGDTQLVDLRLELEEALPLPILQRGKLKQALLNLGKNAVEALVDSGGGVFRISSMYLPVNEHRPIILCFANTSPRIAPEDIERFFEPFHTSKAGGTGLGIPIAYQAVVSNGGILECDWEEDEIRFWVRLPMDASLEPRRSSGVIRKTPIPIRREDESG